jgi:hypothetical protein
VVVLIEHQSTINENMPLRLLLYIAKICEKITGKKAVRRFLTFLNRAIRWNR